VEAMGLSRNFTKLLIGQALANLADVLFIVAVIVLVQEYTKSAFITGMIPIVRVSALFISGLIAPLVMDRFSLRMVLIGSLVGESLFLFLIAILFNILISGSGFYFLFLLMFGLGFFKGWSNPARNALLPRLLHRDLLVKANSLMATSDQVVQMAGWAMGGVVIILLGWRNTFWLSLGLLFISIIFIGYVQYLEAHKTEKQVTFSRWDAMKSGWITIWKTPMLRIVTLMDVIEGIANGVWAGAIIIVYVNEVLHKSSSWFGFINASYFVGTISGGLLAMYLSRFIERRLIFSMIAGSLGIAAMTFVFALSSVPTFSLLLCMLMGPAFQLRDIAQRSIFQTQVKASELPKVYSAQGTIIAGTFGISVLVMGIVTDLFGVRVTYIAASVLFFISGIIALTIMRTSTIKIAHGTNDHNS
jgi:MFS family permease